MEAHYTLRLLSLECLQAQELDGDEAYLTLNDQRIWAAAPDKMLGTPNQPMHVSHYDFAAGRKLTRDGWVAIDAFQPERFIFTGLRGQAMLRLWDADILTSDDMLGETPISARDGAHGHIAVMFTREGAQYRLSYAVDVEARL